LAKKWTKVWWHVFLTHSVLLASLTQQCILAYFLQETVFLKFNINGMPVADGSFGWRWLVNFSAAYNHCESAGDGLALNRLALARNDGG